MEAVPAGCPVLLLRQSWSGASPSGGPAVLTEWHHGAELVMTAMTVTTYQVQRRCGPVLAAAAWRTQRPSLLRLFHPRLLRLCRCRLLCRHARPPQLASLQAMPLNACQLLSPRPAIAVATCRPRSASSPRHQPPPPLASVGQQPRTGCRLPTATLPAHTVPTCAAARAAAVASAAEQDGSRCRLRRLARRAMCTCPSTRPSK